MTPGRYNGLAHLRVDRLKRLYWPRDIIGMYRLPPVLSALPHPDFMREYDRDDLYHYGRVRYFYDLILKGEPVDPVTVLAWGRGRIVADVHDGHHRYVAHVLAKADTIPALFDGSTGALDWLTCQKNPRKRTSASI